MNMFIFLLQVLIGIIAGCVLCAVLTATNVIPYDPSLRSFRTRTDARAEVLYQARWFTFPYPGIVVL